MDENIIYPKQNEKKQNDISVKAHVESRLAKTKFHKNTLPPPSKKKDLLASFFLGGGR